MQSRSGQEAIQRFEEAWSRGGSPRIADYLSIEASNQTSDEIQDNVLAKLISIDLNWKARTGQPIDAADYQSLGDEAVELAEASINRHRSLETEFGQGDTSTAHSDHVATSHRPHADADDPSATIEPQTGPGADRFSSPKPQVEDNSDRNGESDAGQSINWMTEPGGAVASRGRYVIRHELGQGGLGIVWKCEDTELNRTVALKEIRGDRADDHTAQEAFRAEAEITGLLEHPGVVPIYSLGNGEDGRPYYAMQLISRVEMRDRVLAFHRDTKKGEEKFVGPGLRRLLARMIDVCNVVRYAHSRGVYHRDLKTSNVMIGKYGETFVIDWGLAKTTGMAEEVGSDSAEQSETPVSLGHQTGPIARQGAPAGTIAYAPLEQLLGEHDRVDARSDIYALGAMLYEILTGKPPCARMSLSEAIRAIENGLIPSAREKNPQVPGPLSAIAAKALAARPEDRYQVVREFRNDLQHWLDDEPVEAYPESALERLSRWKRRHQTFVRVATAALLMLTLVSGVAAFMINESRKDQMRAREQATQLYAVARSATDKFLLKASDRLKEVPRMTQVRRELLTDAADAYRTMLRVQSDREDLRRESALAGIELANVQKELDAYDDAVQSLIESRNILKQSNNPADRLLIAKTLIEESRIQGLKSPRDTDAAIDSINRAMKLVASIPATGATESHVLKTKAEALIQQGIVAHDLGDEEAQAQFSATSDELFTQAVAQFNQLFDQFENSQEIQEYRISAMRALVNSLHNDSDDRRYASAIEAADRFLQSDPNNSELLSEKGLLLNNYGEFLLDANKPEAAAENFQKAAKLFEKIAKKHFDVLDYRDSWILALNNTARALQDLPTGEERSPEAINDAIVDVLQKSVTVADLALDQTDVGLSFVDRAATAKSLLGSQLLSSDAALGEQHLRNSVLLAKDYFNAEDLKDEETRSFFYRLEYPLAELILARIDQQSTDDVHEQLSMLWNQSAEFWSPAIRMYIATVMSVRIEQMNDTVAQQQYLDFAAELVRKSLAIDPSVLSSFQDAAGFMYLQSRRPAAFVISTSSKKSNDDNTMAPAADGPDSNDSSGTSGT